MSKIRVLLADDHTIVRKGLYSLLEDEEDITVIGEAEDGYEATQKILELRPDVVIMDIGMPSLNGLEALKVLKKDLPEIKVLILTMHANEEYIIEALKSGACGYLLKKSAPGELTSAIRIANAGETYLSPSITTKVINRFIQETSMGSVKGHVDIVPTTREREIIQLIAEGHSNKEIADKLTISLKTVKNHRSNLMEKLSLHNPAEITQYAIRNGILILDA